MSLFLIGAGFNADAAAEVGPVFGNSFDGRFPMNCAYPLVADVAHLCFELDQVPANKSTEQLFDGALAQRDYGPLKKLSYRLMKADYYLATRLSSSENSNWGLAHAFTTHKCGCPALLAFFALREGGAFS